MAPQSTQRALSVYLYIPNIIGYFRIIINCVAFALCYSHKTLFAILYFFSFFCDGLDGWFARKFNQVSTFGAVLDMVTDRVSTACLLAVLSQLYRPGLIFLLLLGLDITSHWFQMYSTFLSGKTSHKDVKDKNNWLLKAYYGHRPFMAFCCVASEVCLSTIKETPLLSLSFFVTLIGWAVKQVINVIQMKTAADSCVFYDTKRSK
ncbi:probable CDP-diacylglycerol--inositol 3-phosphatidyltransferase 2 isoform X2 [Typha latifolia]|uniref:probable CDP-diacylglycerol--inositol 3-phosphatidyltransferase 2 isoform X2 n=1 Tax=Typha latifolia TaxID=4733 RepID=UPI003C2E1768